MACPVTPTTRSLCCRDSHYLSCPLLMHIMVCSPQNELTRRHVCTSSALLCASPLQCGLGHLSECVCGHCFVVRHIAVVCQNTPASYRTCSPSVMCLLDVLVAGVSQWNRTQCGKSVVQYKTPVAHSWRESLDRIHNVLQ